MKKEKGKRIAFTPSKRLEKAIESFAAVQGKSKGAVVSELLESTTIQLEKLAAMALIAKKAASKSHLLGEKAVEKLSDDLLGSQKEIMGFMASIDGTIDEQLQNLTLELDK